ncbi:Uncharacterised protein [Klebsiella variicola]|uniref:hypothetical protein n=1 Tax=Klebsiella pneumoniae complex TaxID=3390273 RepID=UPI000E2A582E|nr:hypothetical protein [Klebsiella variicola]SXE64327.1 Uncharacterised protein [Klebsiella variicola]
MEIKTEFSRIDWGYAIHDGGLYRHGIMIIDISIGHFLGTDPEFFIKLEYQRQYDEQLSIKELMVEAEQWARSQLKLITEFAEC